MMPDAEPLAETIEADATAAAASEIVDVTDAAVAEPDTEQARSDPDAATDGGSASAGSTPLADVPRADRRDRLRKVGAIVFITVVVLGAATVTVTRSPFFAARTIEVRGVSHVPRSQVLRIAAVTSDTNVFTLDAGAAERRLERDPWIADATVTKDLPSTLVVDIHERIAVAVAESDGVRVAGGRRRARSSRPRSRDAAIGMPSIVSADAEGAEPPPEAVGGAARRDRRDGADAAPADRRHLDPGRRAAPGRSERRGRARHTASRSSSRRKPMALRALLDYAAERGATVVSVDVRVPSAPTALLAGGEVVTP